MPYVYIGIAVLASLFVSIYIRLARHVKQSVMLMLTQAFFISNVVLFWVLFKHQDGWLFPIIYIWAGIYGVIAPMQVWTLSNFVLTTREAKRLYGFIGSGGVLGGIMGGFFSSWMVPVIGTENLLLSIAFFLAVCIPLISLIWHKSTRRSLKAHHDKVLKRGDMPSNLMQSLSLIGRSRYLILIAAIISIGSVATTMIDFQFKAVAEESIGAKDQLTAFFGNFYGYLGIGSFLLQFFLTSKLMRRFGIGVTIFLLPIGLILGSSVLLVYTTLWAAVMLKSPDQLFKHSIDKSTVEMLYLPVPTGIKAAVKSFIDTTIWRLADGFAGILLLLLTTVLALSVKQLTVVNLIILGIWVMVAIATRKGYVEALRNAIHRADEDESDELSAQDDEAVRSLVTSLKSKDTEEVLRGLKYIEMVAERDGLLYHVENLLDHRSPNVRARAIAVLYESGDRRLADRIKRLLKDNSPEVQEQAIHFICAHGGKDHTETTKSFLNNDNYSVRAAAVCCALQHDGSGQHQELAKRFLTEMMKSKDAHAKQEAARLLAVINPPSALHNALKDLLTDPDPEVAEQAIESAGKIRRVEFVPLIIEKLARQSTRTVAQQALTNFGAEILPLLGTVLNEEHTDLEIRRALPQVVSQIGTQQAVDILSEALSADDEQLRTQVIKGLNKIRSLTAEASDEFISWPLATINDRILAEAKECFVTLALAKPFRSHGKVAEGQVDLLTAYLEERRASATERVFRLLGLIYQHDDLYHAFNGVESEDTIVRANALELLDNLLDSDHKRLLLPIIDDEVSSAKRAEISAELGVPARMTKEAALAQLCQERDPLVTLIAIDAIYANKINALYGEIERAAGHSDRTVQETARNLQVKLLARRQRAEGGYDFQYYKEMREQMSDLTILDRMKSLQKVILFAHCKVGQLLAIAQIAHKVSFKKMERIFLEGDPGDALYCIVAGKVRLYRKGTAFKTVLGERETFGTLSILDRKPREVSAVAEDRLTALKIDSDLFYNLLSERVDILQSIFTRLTQEIREHFDLAETPARRRTKTA